MQKTIAVVAAVAAAAGLGACGSVPTSGASSAAARSSSPRMTTMYMPSSAPTMSAQDLYKLGEDSVFQIYGQVDGGSSVASGTGFLVDRAGQMAITNAHVVAGMTATKARFADGTTTALHVMAVDPCTDLAVVHLPTLPSYAQQLGLANSSSVQSGDTVTALGYPQSLAVTTGETVPDIKLAISEGLVQGTKVDAKPSADLPEYTDTIQHGATLNHGNSGGPLFNTAGRVIGINTLTDNDTQGQYYSISSDVASSELNKLMSGANQNYLGWTLASLSDNTMADLAPEYGLGTAAQGAALDNDLKGIQGMVVTDVDPGSAVENKASAGDLITKVQNTAVTSLSDTCNIIESIMPGQTVRISGIHLFGADAGRQFVAEFTDPGMH